MESKDKPLFGEQDLIINTLSVEIVEIKEQIKATQTAIENKEEKLEEFEKRRANLDRSLELAKNQAGMIKTSKPGETTDAAPPAVK